MADPTSTDKAEPADRGRAETERIAPCPFCGGEAKLEKVSGSTGNSRWTVGCNETDENDGGSAFSILCYGYQSLTIFATKQEAIIAWNRRDQRAIRLARAAQCREDAAALCGVTVSAPGLSRAYKEGYYDSRKDAANSLIALATELEKLP